MFGPRYFGGHYWGAHYFGAGAGVPVSQPGQYFGAHYWGGAYFGRHYWGTRPPSVIPPVVEVPAYGGIRRQDLPYLYLEHPRRRVVYLHSLARFWFTADAKVSKVYAVASEARPGDVRALSEVTKTHALASHCALRWAPVGRVEARSAPSTARFDLEVGGSVAAQRAARSTAGFTLRADAMTSRVSGAEARPVALHVAARSSVATARFVPSVAAFGLTARSAVDVSTVIDRVAALDRRDVRDLIDLLAA